MVRAYWHRGVRRCVRTGPGEEAALAQEYLQGCIGQRASGGRSAEPAPPGCTAGSACALRDGQELPFTAIQDPNAMDMPVAAPSRRPRPKTSVPALDQGGAQARLPRQPVLHAGQVSGAGDQARLLPGARLRGARPPAAALDQHRGGLHQAALAHRRLPVGRVPDGPAPGQQPDQPRHLSAGAAGDRRAGPGPRRAAAAGGGAGPGQRRPRAPGRVLPRFAGDAGDPHARLRHPLRVRHLRAGDRRRLAGRAHRQVAALRQSVGDRAAGVGGGGRSSAGTPSSYTDEHGRLRVRWVPERVGDGRALRHAHPRLSHATPRTRCGCGAPRRRSRSTSPCSTAATTTAR